MSITGRKSRNFKIFATSASLTAFAVGLFTPFYFIFVRDFGGGLEQYGMLIGIMMVAASIMAYFAGKYSDKLGRKPLLLLAGFVISLVIFTYSLVTTLIQLYVVQILQGLMGSLYETMEVSFLGDLTKKATRGKSIGWYKSLIGISSAFAIMLSGFLAGAFGVKIIFYVTAAMIFISTIILIWIKE